MTSYSLLKHPPPYNKLILGNVYFLLMKSTIVVRLPQVRYILVIEKVGIYRWEHYIPSRFDNF